MSTINHHNNLRTLATSALQTAWADRLPLIYPNSGQKPPSAGSWGRFTLTTGNTNNAALSGQMRRTAVVFGVQLHLPLERGIKEAYEAADALQALENQNYLSTDQKTTLKTRTTSVMDGGVADGYKIFSITIDAICDTELVSP